MTRLAALGAALSAWLLPALSLACPQCAGRTKGGALETAALGAFLLLPFVAAGIVVKVVRAHGDGGGREPQNQPTRALGPVSSTWQLDRRRQAE